MPNTPCKGGGRKGTGDDWMIEVVVVPSRRNRSRMRSSCSIRQYQTFRTKQSSPVTRWHSTTSGIRRASSPILLSCPDSPDADVGRDR